MERDVVCGCATACKITFDANPAQYVK